jgi:hypothetical protein
MHRVADRDREIIYQKRECKQRQHEEIEFFLFQS